jgi:hypothetical protein
MHDMYVTHHTMYHVPGQSFRKIVCLLVFVSIFQECTYANMYKKSVSRLLASSALCMNTMSREQQTNRRLAVHVGGRGLLCHVLHLWGLHVLNLHIMTDIQP